MGTAAVTAVLVALVAGVALTACGGGAPTVARTSGSGPARAYRCQFDLDTMALTGADGTASAIGWAGNHQGVVTCLGGTFFVQGGVDRNYGFGIYDGSPTLWADLDGYLPAQVTTFHRAGAVVAITEFADRVVLGSHPFVAVYSRVAVRNPTAQPVRADPEPSPGMVPLDSAPVTVKAHGTAAHDYVVVADRFGAAYPWPTAAALAAAGGFDRHLAHMRAFWNAQLAAVASLSLPDTSLVDAYRSGFITTEITRSGDAVNTGVNGYQSEFSHDVIGILVTLFTQGDFADAHALLLDDRNLVGTQNEYQDGGWTYAWPWAVYLMKTGDLAFVKANFARSGPSGSSEPSIEDTAHAIAAARTGPGGIMERTNDLDFEGFWTSDDYEALLGLAAYGYLAGRVGDAAEVQWARQQYAGLLAATDATLSATISRYGLDYLPCSMLEPNSANTCANPEDANWASPFGHWAWDAALLGAPVSGPGVSMIDATYAKGFGRLAGLLPPDTFGGFPSDWYSTAYNAGYGSTALAGTAYRDQGILSYEFMIANDQSGPESWWESSTAPSSTTPWVGRHPAAGQGSSPHAWGMAQADKVLLDSLVAQRADGALIVGRGVPSVWLASGTPITVGNFPTVDGRRMGLRITATGGSVSLAMSGDLPPGPVLFELPAFVNAVASTSAGTVDEADGTVTLPPGTATVTVHLR